MNRNGIINHIELWAAKLGSYSSVAKYCGVNAGALSAIRTGKYGANEQAMLQKIAHALNYRESDWKMVRTVGNYRLLETLFRDAKQESMWFALSNKAGSGKTGTLEDIFNLDTTGSVVFIQCAEWTGRQFLTKLVEKTLGETALKGSYKSLADLTDMVVNFFNGMSLDKPVLIIDEGDKLRPAALRSLIPIYNRTEGRLGLILSGTENLKKELSAGVRLRKKGYDEIESRLGRTYITLKGITERETVDICLANGINDEETALRIWGELPKEKKPTRVRVPNTNNFKETMVSYAEDLRLLRRLIKRETLIKKDGVGE